MYREPGGGVKGQILDAWSPSETAEVKGQRSWKQKQDGRRSEEPEPQSSGEARRWRGDGVGLL